MRSLIAIALFAGTLIAADNWERSKECATQSEKVAREEGVALTRSHYSPKYNRCFAYLNNWPDHGGCYLLVFRRCL